MESGQDNGREGSMNTVAWISWLVTALVMVSLTRNPLYLILVMLCLQIVSLTLRRAHPQTSFPVSPMAIAGTMIILGAAFNGLTSHFGATVIFHLPKQIPLLGGPITLEAIIYGAINGLVLSGIFAAFTTLNQALPAQALIRLIPQAFYPLALVTSIGVTFVPNTMRQFQQIREAQAIRGHHLKGLKDWLPLIIPLLVGGMERALQLSEAMTARGFAGAPATRRGVGNQAWLLAGLALLMVGGLLQLDKRSDTLYSQHNLGLLLVSIGILLIIGVLFLISRRAARTVYHRESFSQPDAIILFSCVLMLFFWLIPLPFTDLTTLRYNPYPALSPPLFDPWLGIAALGLLIPLLFIRVREP